MHQSRRPSKSHDAYSEELAQIEDELTKDSERLHEYVEELRTLGVEPKNGPEGLIDFPSLIDGRVVYLCWKLGEPEVLHWHELEAGFPGRQFFTQKAYLAIQWLRPGRAERLTPALSGSDVITALPTSKAKL